jgi:hypothetical protein
MPFLRKRPPRDVVVYPLRFARPFTAFIHFRRSGFHSQVMQSPDKYVRRRVICLFYVVSREISIAEDIQLFIFV